MRKQDLKYFNPLLLCSDCVFVVYTIDNTEGHSAEQYFKYRIQRVGNLI